MDKTEVRKRVICLYRVSTKQQVNKSNSFGESKDKLGSYYRYIIFDNGNSYINLNCTSTTSSSKYYQNVRIGLGVNNTTIYKTINDSNVGQRYETLYNR